MVTAREVNELVEDRPDLEQAIETVLDADEPFTFDDVDVDSGRFGEIVAAGIVEKRDDGYRVTDRRAVERGLSGAVDAADESGRGFSRPAVAVGTRVAGALAGAVLFVVLLRTVFSVDSVFQGGAVVLSGNDPYYYRYWVEQLLSNPDVTLSSLPDGVAKGEPLYVATMWAVASLFGGDATTTGWVLAWYPVVSALFSGVLVYLLTVEVTRDRRVGLAAVVLLAVIAGHALRTSLGFADHHAFDYPWLGVTALSLVAVVRGELRSTRTVLGTAGLVVGVSGQVLAWEAGPLLIAPLGLAVAALSVVWVRTGESPLHRGTPVLVGIGLAAAVTWLVHATLGWHTNVVASAPALLFAGSLGVLLVSELVSRVRADERVVAGAVVGSGLASVAAVAVLLPTAWATLMNRLDGSLFRSDNIAETQGLFADSGGWLLLFGFVLFLTIPYLLWGTRRALDEEEWVVPVAYAWGFFALSVIQVRFVGEFAAFAAVFAGLGYVHLAERIDVARLPKPFGRGVDGTRLTMPTARQAVALVVLFLLIGGLGIVQVPIKTGQITHPDARYETAAWMADYTERPEWSDQPEYVFSQWGHNRLYNYFVSGDSLSYGYARANYGAFLGSADGQAWYDRLRGRAGFVVYRGIDGPSGSIAERLDAYGSRTENANGLSHYRAVYVSETREYRVFTLVPGATISGTAEADTTVTLSTTVRVNGTEIEYERRVRTTGDGAYTVIIPYPGVYTTPTGEVRVSEQAVRNGTRVAV